MVVLLIRTEKNGNYFWTDVLSSFGFHHVKTASLTGHVVRYVNSLYPLGPQ